MKADQTIHPDAVDYDAMSREHGPLSPTATEARRAERYRLAQANKLIRLYGPPPQPTWSLPKRQS